MVQSCYKRLYINVSWCTILKNATGTCTTSFRHYWYRYQLENERWYALNPSSTNGLSNMRTTCTTTIGFYFIYVVKEGLKREMGNDEITQKFTE